MNISSTNNPYSNDLTLSHHPGDSICPHHLSGPNQMYPHISTHLTSSSYPFHVFPQKKTPHHKPTNIYQDPKNKDYYDQEA